MGLATFGYRLDRACARLRDETESVGELAIPVVGCVGRCGRVRTVLFFGCHSPKGGSVKLLELVVIALSDDLRTSSSVDRLLLSLGEGSASRSSIRDQPEDRGK